MSKNSLNNMKIAIPKAIRVLQKRIREYERLIDYQDKLIDDLDNNDLEDCLFIPLKF